MVWSPYSKDIVKFFSTVPNTAHSYSVTKLLWIIISTFVSWIFLISMGNLYYHHLSKGEIEAKRLSKFLSQHKKCSVQTHSWERIHGLQPVNHEKIYFTLHKALQKSSLRRIFSQRQLAYQQENCRDRIDKNCPISSLPYQDWSLGNFISHRTIKWQLSPDPRFLDFPLFIAPPAHHSWYRCIS